MIQPDIPKEIKITELHQCLENVGASKDEAIDIFQRAQAMRKSLSENETKNLPLGEGHDFKVLVSDNMIRVIGIQFAKGTFSKAHYLTNFSNEGKENTSPHIIKVGQSIGVRYSPEAMRTQKLPETVCDVPYTTFYVNGLAHAEHRRYDGDWSRFNYATSPHPATDLFWMIWGAVIGLHAMHQDGTIHRDIKSLNLLQKRDPETNKMRGAVTDFGLSKPTPTRTHRTACTPPFLKPSNFGNAKESVVNQRKREGFQTWEGDVFALGQTLERGAIELMLYQLAKKYNCENKIKGILHPHLKLTPCEEVFESRAPTDLALSKLGEKYPHRAFYLDPSRRYPRGMVVVVQPKNERQAALHRAVSEISKHISVKEEQLLHELVEICVWLQGDENCPDCMTIHTKLKELQRRFFPDDETLPIENLKRTIPLRMITKWNPDENENNNNDTLSDSSQSQSQTPGSPKRLKRGKTPLTRII